MISKSREVGTPCTVCCTAFGFCYYIFRSNIIINKASQMLMPCFSFGLGSYKESAGSRQELIWKAKSIQGKQFKKMLFSSTAARICEVSKHPYMGMCVIRWDLYTKTGGFLTLKQWWEQEVKEQYNKYPIQNLLSLREERGLKTAG